jgi:hypothetical protein
VTITVTNENNGLSTSTFTDEQGRWIVSNIASGKVKIQAEAGGFKSLQSETAYQYSQPANFNFNLPIASTAEAVMVEAEASSTDTVTNHRISNLPTNGRNAMQLQQMASANVMNLQRRVAGVLPVAIDVPRAGTSFQFVRPLVLGEETKVSFNYKSRG